MIVQSGKRIRVPIIADGGIKYSGDIVKAIAAGAHAVMLGSMFAGRRKALEKQKFIKEENIKYIVVWVSRRYESRFQRSLFPGDTDEKKLVPEGIEGRVPYKGALADTIHQLVGGYVLEWDIVAERLKS